MKELADKHLVQRLKDLITYKDHFKNLVEKFNEEVKNLKEQGVAEKEVNTQLEEKSFELIVLRDDLLKTASEVETIVELYRKTNEDLPDEYKDITSKIPDYKEGSRLDVYTFVVDGDKVVEKEKGILKSKLELTRKSDVYNKFKDLK